MVNHGDAVHSDEWRHLPIDEQMSWRIPISLMLNMTLLRNTQSVVTVAEYLRLHGIDENREASDGRWDRVGYHSGNGSAGGPTLHVIENGKYDPREVNRVDTIPDDMKQRGGWIPPSSSSSGYASWGQTRKTVVYATLEGALPDRPKVLPWDRAREVLTTGGFINGNSRDEEVERVLKENGWEVLFTYDGAYVTPFFYGCFYLQY